MQNQLKLNIFFKHSKYLMVSAITDSLIYISLPLIFGRPYWKK